MDMLEFELIILNYLEVNAKDINSDNLSDIGDELRDIVDLACSEYALDKGLEYEVG